MDREEPWKVRFWGVGNENWGCGGNMTAEYYAGEYRRYSTYCKNYGENRLFKIAGGANSFDYNWTEVLMKNIPLNRMNGISLHYYTVPRTWGDKGSATQFDESEYFVTLEKCLRIEELIRKHSTIMDRHDPDKRIGLMVDEWGTWYNVEPGTNPGFLYQQNTLRDALVAAISLNIFNQNCERVKMANIAQTVNVLQAMILTKNEKMVLTPTYHVYDMYKPHKEATLLSHHLVSEAVSYGNEIMDALHVSTSKSEDGTVNISIANIHPDKKISLDVDVRGMDAKSASAEIVTAPAIDAYNTFEKKDVVKKSEFKDFKLNKGKLTVNLPANSVLMLRVK
jgi:alpha-L-arabinofuranosidase